MKYLHIMRNDKFINEFIIFINQNFNLEEHEFIIIDGIHENIIPFPNEKNVKNIISKGNKINNRLIRYFIFFIQYPYLIILLFLSFFKKDKIFFHGLVDLRIIIFLFIFKRFLKKSSWIMWGGDLYSNYFKMKKKIKLTLKQKIYLYIDKKVKKNFKSYITFIEKDYIIMQEYCGGNGNLLLSFAYPSNFYKDVLLEKNKKNEIWIQIGNSEDPENNHIEILEKIKKFANLNIRVFVILSYTKEMNIYKKKVMEKGKEIFGEKFEPITNFMEYFKYIKFLSNIDIAIFAHNRQQAFGNITSLLSMKKTVYLKEKVGTYQTLINMGIKLKSFDKFENLEVFNDEILEKNKEIMKENFSKKKLVEQWTKIFNS